MKVINVERPGISAYVTCGRDGTIKFWHKGTFAHFRTIRHLDAMKAAYEIIIMASDLEDADALFGSLNNRCWRTFRRCRRSFHKIP